ncbi:helix-turn-helix domain-containing protein [Streptomyces sp. NPDC004609]|uniref:helix-turn-helix domain-containing protein n=1 Tax=Streptomyces sp. NPDC004609 TaxID=3364704 RepID=UPI00368C4275
MTTLVSETGVGPLLRDWRERRRMSQLDLALRADSSARHISFIETGRSRPSEEMILRLSEHLEIPVREQNALLVAGGFAPRFSATDLDDPSMSTLREGMQQLLHGYEPYPAVIVDGAYNIVAANLGMTRLIEGVPEHLLTPPLNGMRITLHPEGMARRIRNFCEWRGHLLHQMERQMALARSEALRQVYDEVAAYPLPEGCDDLEGTEETPARYPYFALPMVIEHRGQMLTFISSICTFNTPMDVTVAELAIEAFLPADPATVDYLRSLTS